jgi:hypothetical protein
MSFRSFAKTLGDLGQLVVEGVFAVGGISLIYSAVVGSGDGKLMLAVGGALLLLVPVISHWGSGRGRTSTRAVEDGYVYVLSNPNLPGKVKIGYTRRSVAQRAKELSGTGVPGRYKVAYKLEVADPEGVEKAVHRKLSSQNIDGEFFGVSPQKAAKVIKSEAQAL